MIYLSKKILIQSKQEGLVHNVSPFQMVWLIFKNAEPQIGYILL